MGAPYVYSGMILAAVEVLFLGLYFAEAVIKEGRGNGGAEVNGRMCACSRTIQDAMP